MEAIDLQGLNEQFGIEGQLSFEAGAGKLPVAEIENEHGAARVSLYGGQVLAYRPRGRKPALWLSRHSRYEQGEAIRGGIPICWPWFGTHPTDPDRPAHGFARIKMWTVTGTEALPGRETQLRLTLADDEETRAMWPQPFRLELAVTVGRRLQVTLTARNPGRAAFTTTGALHSYFSVSDVTAIAIHGLDGRAYMDTVDGWQQKNQAGPVVIAGETDRIYLNTTDTCRIEDPGWQRQIVIDKAGSRSTVIWNPWTAKSARLADFGNDEYTGMVCVETANADDDVVLVQPGGEQRLETTIRVGEF